MAANGVGLGDLGCTITPGGCSLIVTTFDIPASGVTLAFIGVTLGTATGTSPPAAPPGLDFSVPANSMYLPIILGGFA